MDPATAATAVEAAKAGSDGLASASKFYDTYERSRAEKRKAKESKRKTLAELLNEVMGREFKAGEGMRERGADLAKARANSMQNLASQYVQALR